jgi:chromosome partitioning protein
MGMILTVSGPAGGVGKTTVAVNLAAALALYEKKVLVVDCDPRGSATAWLHQTDDAGHPDLSSLLGETAAPEDTVIHTDLPWMDLIPAGFSLFHTAWSLTGDVSRQTFLKTLIDKHFKEIYDYVIIDAPSSFGFLSVLAMTAGDWLVVPVWPDRTRETDCQCLLRLIHFNRKTHDTRQRIAGFVFNGCGSAREIQTFLKNRHLTRLTDLVFDTFIPDDPAVVRAIDHHRPVVLEDINAPSGKAFLRFAGEIDSIFK